MVLIKWSSNNYDMNGCLELSKIGGNHKIKCLFKHSVLGDINIKGYLKINNKHENNDYYNIKMVFSTYDSLLGVMDAEAKLKINKLMNNIKIYDFKSLNVFINIENFNILVEFDGNIKNCEFNLDQLFSNTGSMINYNIKGNYKSYNPKDCGCINLIVR